MRLWSLASGDIRYSFQGNTAAFSADGSLCATGDGRGDVRLWRVSDGLLLRLFAGHSKSVREVTFSADGQCLGSASFDGTVRVWRVSDGSLAHVLRGHKGAVYTVKFSPDCRFVASGGADHTVRICRVADGKLVRVLRRYSENNPPPTPSEPTSISGYEATAHATPKRRPTARSAWSAGALARASPSHVSRSRRTSPQRSRARARVLRGHTECVRHIAFSPDGALLATACLDRSVRIWAVNDGALLHVLQVRKRNDFVSCNLKT